jgi:Putative restriction endonuclease
MFSSARFSAVRLGDVSSGAQQPQQLAAATPVQEGQRPCAEREQGRTEPSRRTPDLALEIFSPESTTRDRRDKLREYRAAGVREY